MEANNINHIIRKFFENKFSKELQLRFQYWYRLNSNNEEKDEALQTLLEESPSVITPQTWEDLSKIRKQISDNQTTKHNRPVFHRFMKYAAVIVLVLLSSLSTYYFTSKTNAPEPPKFVEFFVPYGDRQKIVLADGSEVWVNAGSVLIYPEKFTASTRSVYLSGEANFKVAKNPDQPFIVKTKHINVEALGTVFDVQSYPNALFTTATLEEGKVRVGVKSKEQSSAILKPDERLSYCHITQKVTIESVNAKALSSWKEGYLIFRDAAFEDILSTLERKYNVQINYNADRYNGGLYHVKFNPNESINDALAVLSQFVGFRYKVGKEVIYIY